MTKQAICRVRMAAVAAMTMFACANSAQAAGTDARAYVQDGLVFHWDAIDNAGYGVHSDTTNVWKNLVGTDATTDWKLNADTYTWTEVGLKMLGNGRVGSMTAGKETFLNAFKAAKDGKLTIEFVYANANNGENPGVIFGPGFGSNIQLYTTKKNGNFHVGFYGSSSQKYGYAAGLNATNAYSVVYEVNTSGSNAGKATGNNITFTVNGKAEENAGMSNYCADYMGEPVLGGRTISGYVAKGTLMAIRIYARELTAAERTRNNDLDQYRFIEGSRIASYEVSQGSAGALQGTVGFYAGNAGDEVWLVSDTEDKGIKSLDDWGSCEKVDTLGAQAITKPYSFAGAGETDRIYRFAVKSSQSGFVAFTDATTVEAWASVKKTEVTDDPQGTTAELAITIDNCGIGCDKCDVYVAWGENDFVEVKKGAVFGETVSYTLKDLTGDGAVSYRVKTVNKNKEKVFDYSFWHGFAWHYDATAKTITDGSNWVLNVTWKPGSSEITVTGPTSGSGELDLRDFAVETDGVSSVRITKLFIGDSAFLRCGETSGAYCKPDITLTSFRATKLAGNLAGAFSKCKHLTNLEVSGESVTELGYDASSKWGFVEQSAALKTVKMDFPNLTKIGILAFGKCSALETPIDELLPSAVTNVEEFAFFECAAGGKAYLPNVDAIGMAAFTRSGVQEVEVGPNGDFTTLLEAEYVSRHSSYKGTWGVFQECASLTNVTLAVSGAITLGDSCFISCTSLANVTVNAKSCAIDSRSFKGDTALASMTFNVEGDVSAPYTVDNFNGCSSLSKIFFTGPAPQNRNILDLMLTAIKTSSTLKGNLTTTIYADPDKEGWTALADPTNATEAAYAPAGCFGVYRKAADYRKAWLVNPTVSKPVTDDDGKEVVVKVPKSWMEKNGLTDKEIDDTGANGLPLWQDYALGLDPNDLDAQTVVLPVQTSDAGHLTLTLGDFAPKTDTGMTVGYRLGTKTDAGGSFVYGEEQAAYQFEVALPASGVQYYIIQARFHGKGN